MADIRNISGFLRSPQGQKMIERLDPIKKRFIKDEKSAENPPILWMDSQIIPYHTSGDIIHKLFENDTKLLKDYEKTINDFVPKLIVDKDMLHEYAIKYKTMVRAMRRMYGRMEFQHEIPLGMPMGRNHKMYSVGRMDLIYNEREIADFKLKREVLFNENVLQVLTYYAITQRYHPEKYKKITTLSLLYPLLQARYYIKVKNLPKRFMKDLELAIDDYFLSERKFD